MQKSTCKHCVKEIGLWTTPWGTTREWMHAPDDGPDAHMECDCQCDACKAEKVRPEGCIDGEVAEPAEAK